MSDPDWAHHCGDLWRAAVLEATGRDICDVVGASPRRSADWVAMMRRLEVRSLSGVVSAVHGSTIDVRQARRGDIVRIGWALGVCRGEVAEFFGSVRPLSEAEEAWGVGGWPHG